jgi:hypothetical protein
MDDSVQGKDTPRMDELAAVYIKIRDERARLKQDFEHKDIELEAQMNLLGEEMLNLCKELGADSIRTPAGTVIRTVKSRYWTNDWDSMYQFIKDNDAFGLLEKRLHQTNMKDFLSENPDVYPKGMNVESQFTVTVRRAKEK